MRSRPPAPRGLPEACLLLSLLAEAAGATPLGPLADGGQVSFIDYDCMRIPFDKQIIDWSEFHTALVTYLERKQAERRVETVMGGLPLKFSEEVAALQEAMIALPEGSSERRAAREQCPLGLLALCVVEATALASMRTEDLELKFQCIQELLSAVSVFALAGAKWPIWRLLDRLWLLNKVDFRGALGYTNINRFVQRQYADLILSPEELAPFGAGRSVPWNSWLQWEDEGSSFHARVEELMAASKAGYNGFGPMVQGLASAVWESVQRDGTTATAGGRPLVRIALVFGREWAHLAPLAWARWAALGLRAVVYAAMDEAALEVCYQFHLTCVPTGVPSILHKYSLATLALHLGVDVLYCDLDAVPLGPGPLSYMRAALAAEGADGQAAADLAVSTHNFDCLNAGLWLARASAASASFFLGLLAYLYEHWYEGDQRAFNAFATGNVSVSFQADTLARLPKVRVAVLSPDIVAGSEGFPEVDQVRLFHAYRLYGEEKLRLVGVLYGLPQLPASAGVSRGHLWRWVRGDGDASGGAVAAAAAAALAPYVRPRTSTVCW